MREFEFIDDLMRRSVAHPNVEVGIGDDAAVLKLDSKRLVVTTDTMVEHVHFFSETPAACIGHKLVQMNVSDLVAMGAKPKFATLNLSLPSMSSDWLEAFMSALNSALSVADCVLVGGNTTSSAQMHLGLTVFGEPLFSKPLLRSTASVGDVIAVSGSLGGAAAVLNQLYELPIELRALDNPDYTAWHRPTARLDLLASLAEATSMIDISDGLLQDLAHLCQQSRVGAELISASIPVTDNATLNDALHGGEDYQLLGTWRDLSVVPTGFRVIGRCVSEERILLDQQVIEPKGWDHFHGAESNN
ncbi:MAG: thiamine-phosphate kinase [Gammaproteobacteria bacterium]|nr:thiamine-phosphate kinase [Gammaproteobacteria bacterium]